MGCLRSNDMLGNAQMIPPPLPHNALRLRPTPMLLARLHHVYLVAFPSVRFPSASRCGAQRDRGGALGNDRATLTWPIEGQGHQRAVGPEMVFDRVDERSGGGLVRCELGRGGVGLHGLSSL